MVRIEKLILVVFAVMLIVAPSAMAFREVTCGSGSIGGLCHETELNDEFDQMDNEKADQSDLNNVINDLDRNTRTDNRQWYQIDKHRDNISSINDVIGANSADWSRDRSGVSWSRVSSFLEGEYWLNISSTFVPMEEYQSLIVRTEHMEKQLHFINLGYTGIYMKGNSMFGYDSNGKLDRLIIRG